MGSSLWRKHVRILVNILLQNYQRYIYLKNGKSSSTSLILFRNASNSRPSQWPENLDRRSIILSSIFWRRLLIDYLMFSYLFSRSQWKSCVLDVFLKLRWSGSSTEDDVSINFIQRVSQSKARNVNIFCVAKFDASFDFLLQENLILEKLQIKSTLSSSWAGCHGCGPSLRKSPMAIGLALTTAMPRSFQSGRYFDRSWLAMLPRV